MSCSVIELVGHFETIYRKHMQGLPIVNSQLSIEAVGFRCHEGHQFGVLITPWFMNLILLPGSEFWSEYEQGSTVEFALPAGAYDFTLSHDDDLGTYLTAVLFRTVSDFPDQDTARNVAETVLGMLFEKPDPSKQGRPKTATLSRRDLFTRLGTS